LRDLTQHLTTRADDNHAPPVSAFPEGHPRVSTGFAGCQALVRFFALLRIKPHAPPLVRAPVTPFESQPRGRTPQAGSLFGYLRHGRDRPRRSARSSCSAGPTRVSKPVCSRGFRASASGTVRAAAFATAVSPAIDASHRYTGNSPALCSPLAGRFPR